MCYEDQKETRVLLRGNDHPRQFSLSDQVNAPRENSTMKESVIGHASLVLPKGMDCMEVRNHTTLPCCHCGGRAGSLTSIPCLDCLSFLWRCIRDLSLWHRRNDLHSTGL